MLRSGLLTAVSALLAIATWPSGAWAQACCAGAGAVTPGRLAVHEDAVIGLQLKGANAFGSYSADATYHGSPARTTEWQFEQDLFGALRVAPRGQVALLVPAMQTFRRTPDQSSFGGGLGDVNLSGRYDFVWAGEARYIPGIALLAGVTFPTGETVESAEDPLGTDAAGIGTYQANLGLALEQTEGPWLFGVTGLVAKRAARTVGPYTTSLAAQWTLLAATAYTFRNDAALALLTSYTVEGDPEINGVTRDATRRVLLFGVAGLYPFTDAWRVQGGLFLTPPISQLGRNTPARMEMVLSLLRSWS
ncbi:MAG TPA: hypothetical protein VK540_35225 [Polyangiaceae bacterium]|jgi:hypothetical protein|nr:hypothetical protein [Polyangiaceae bacterium]